MISLRAPIFTNRKLYFEKAVHIMKTANVINTMPHQQDVPNTQKNSATPSDYKPFSDHFTRELNASGSGRSSVSDSTNAQNSHNNDSNRVSNNASNSAQQTSDKSSSGTGAKTDSQSVSTTATNTPLATSSTKDKKDDKDGKDTTNTDDDNPLMLLFGAMSTVPKTDGNSQNQLASVNAETTKSTSSPVQNTTTATPVALLPGVKNMPQTRILTDTDSSGTVSDMDSDTNINSVADNAFSQKLNDIKNMIENQEKSSSTTGGNTGNDNQLTKVAKDLTLAPTEVTSEIQTKLDKLAAAIPTQSTTIPQNMESIAATGTAETAASTHITQPFGSTGWDKAVGQKVLWMVGESIHSAELSLNPPDLGPLQVVLKVTNEHASASFMSSQPEVREALESSMPKLRQMMVDAGIQLASVSVGTQTSNQGQQGNSYRPTGQNLSQTNRTGANLEQIGVASSSTATTPRVFTSRIGEVDTFA